MNQYHRLRFPREPYPTEARQHGSHPPKAEPLSLESIGSTGIMSIHSVHAEPLHTDLGLDGRLGMYGPVGTVASCR